MLSPRNEWNRGFRGFRGLRVAGVRELFQQHPSSCTNGERSTDFTDDTDQELPKAIVPRRRRRPLSASATTRTRPRQSVESVKSVDRTSRRQLPARVPGTGTRAHRSDASTTAWRRPVQSAQSAVRSLSASNQLGTADYADYAECELPASGSLPLRGLCVPGTGSSRRGTGSRREPRRRGSTVALPLPGSPLSGWRGERHPGAGRLVRAAIRRPRSPLRVSVVSSSSPKAKPVGPRSPERA